EEHVPGRLTGNGKKTIAVPVTPPVEAARSVPVMSVAHDLRAPQASQVSRPSKPGSEGPSQQFRKSPMRGALVIGAATEAELIDRLTAAQKSAQAGQAPSFAPPADQDLAAPERIAIDYADATELANKCGMALKAFAANQPTFWKALRAQGIFR